MCIAWGYSFSCYFILLTDVDSLNWVKFFHCQTLMYCFCLLIILNTSISVAKYRKNRQKLSFISVWIYFHVELTTTETYKDWQLTLMCTVWVCECRSEESSAGESVSNCWTRLRRLVSPPQELFLDPKHIAMVSNRTHTHTQIQQEVELHYDDR